MTLIERATKSANTVAAQTVSTASRIGAAVADGVIVTAQDLRTGLQDGHIRPRTVLAAAAVGLIAVVEWPVLVAAAGAAVIYSKLGNRSTASSHDESHGESEDRPVGQERGPVAP